jgi:hypothetical protein
MQGISPYTINQIAKSIDQKVIEKSFKYIYKETCGLSKEEWLLQYVKDIIANIFYSDTNEFIRPRDVKNNAYRKRQDNKKNWLKAFLEEIKTPNNPLDQEIALGEMLLERLSSTLSSVDVKQKTIELFGVEDLQDLRAVRVKEVEEWATSRTTNLTDYPYLSSKTQFQLERAFKADFAYLISVFILDNYDGDLSKSIIHHPNVLVDTPIFAESQSVMKMFQEVDEENQPILANEYKVDEDFLIRSIIKLKEGDKVIRKTKTLDEKDNTIIQYVLSQRDQRFFTERKIYIDVLDLVVNLYKSKGAKNYQLVEERLQKIARYTIEAIIKKSTKGRDGKLSFTIFDRVIIDTDDAGKRYAEILVGDTLYQQLFNQQTVQIYSDNIKRLENPYSRILIFALQKERLERYIQNKPFRDIFDYKFFAHKVRFQTRKIDNNMEMLNAALQEFKDQNIIIEDFRRIHQSFEITFIPLSHYEIHDFIGPEKEPVQLQIQGL